MSFISRARFLLKKPKPVDKSPLVEAIQDYILAGPGPMEELAGYLGFTVAGLWEYIGDEWCRSSIRAFAKPEDKKEINERIHAIVFKGAVQ